MKISAHTLKIMIVEDDPFYQFLASEVLRTVQDYNMYKYFAQNYEEALTLFIRERPDIVFLDIMLPDGSGLDLLHAFKAMQPHAFITMVSTLSYEGTVKKALEEGSEGYILKPYATEKMVRAIQRYESYRKDYPLLPFDKNCAQQFMAHLKPRPTAKNVSHTDDTGAILATWRVLVADQSEATTEAMRACLAEMVGAVHVAHCGQDALRAIDQEAYHILFLSHNLPGMDGYQVANQVYVQSFHRPLRPSCIALYNHPDDVLPGRLKLAHMEDYLIKPFRIDSLFYLMNRYARLNKRRQEQVYV